MKRKNILFVRLTEITIILTVSIMLAVSCHQQEPLIEKYEKSSVSELRNRGNEFLKKEQTDSALIYYTMAAGKYDRHLPDSLKMECASARCNAGWIHMFFKNDYISAYTSMLDAMEISEECNDSTLYPVIYLNIGNIYLNYAQYDYMLDNYRKAFRAAVGTQD